MRVGTGFDAHAFEDGRVLILGGVRIPEARGLGGHSDADVLVHAIIDALLGAAALGDIGERFPDDERWRDVSSLEMLKRARAEIVEAGWSIVNIDATVIAEAPRISMFRGEMAGNIARILELRAESVSIKGTTTDGLGFAGRREGIAATAVVLLQPDARN